MDKGTGATVSFFFFFKGGLQTFKIGFFFFYKKQIKNFIYTFFLL